MEKKKNIILLAITLTVVLVIIGGAVYSMFFNNNIMKKFDEYFNRENNTLIYYRQDGCTYCEKQAPILAEFVEQYNIDYLDIEKNSLTMMQKKQILEKLGIEDGTPITVIVKNGEVVDKSVGYTDRYDYFNFLQGVGIIPADAEYKGYIKIDYNTYEELINKDEAVVISVGQTGCPHCDAIKPSFDKVVANDDLKIYYLDLATITEDEVSEFFQSLRDMGYDDEDFVSTGSFGTPTTFTIESGEIKYYIGGEKTYSQLKKEFKKQNLIK